VFTYVGNRLFSASFCSGFIVGSRLSENTTFTVVELNCMYTEIAIHEAGNNIAAGRISNSIRIYMHAVLMILILSTQVLDIQKVGYPMLCLTYNIV